MPLEPLLPNLFRWTDSCNVYVLRDGDAALLIDLGDGSVLAALREAGIRTVEWVLFTHHHREQCGGGYKLDRNTTQVAGPELERALFESPDRFRKVDVSLGDPFTVHGASYVRPPVRGFKLDRGFKTMDVFAWHGREIWCLDTRGNSPGGISYLLKLDDGWIAFTGDVMLAGRLMHNWFDTEWDYGFCAGPYALHNAAARIEQFKPKLMLPSHGREIRDPADELAAYRKKVRTAAELLLRGYELKTFAEADQDAVSTPTAVPHVWRITPHLYKFKGPDFWPNFSIVIADSGKALVIDCGLLNEAFLDSAIAGMKERLGLKQVDVCIVTHMHGDHMLQAPHLQANHGTKLWTHERVVALAKNPEHYDYCAMVQSYNKTLKNVAFDRVLRDGETFIWEGFSLTVDWMPGQTEFACCIHGLIDGRKVAFTGDNLFGAAHDPKQDGHEALVARNSATLEEGYQYAADYLHGLAPDLLIGGHCWVIDQPAPIIERYRAWAGRMREALLDLSGEHDYRLTFDPYQVRGYPHRVRLNPGETREVEVRVRNYLPQVRSYRIVIDTGDGIEANPRILEGRVRAEDTAIVPLRLKAQQGAAAGVRIVSFDLSFDDRHVGPWFDMIAAIT